MFKIVLLFISLAVFAQEPGYLLNDAPAPAKESRQRAPSPSKIDELAPIESHKPLPRANVESTQDLLVEQFARARGLQGYEIQTLPYNRISCDRRLYTANGHSVEGDADIKATNGPPDFLEVEFASHVTFESFGAENPYRNGVSDLETVTSRQLVKVRDWNEGAPLQLTRHMLVRYADDKKLAGSVAAFAEVRVMDGTYPSTYIIREIVKTTPEFTLYYFCQ